MPPPPPPPELSDHLLGEAFLRLPPDDPVCLLRASLACKRWRRILADPAFRRRHREFHRTPSVLGFLRTVEGYETYTSRFVPIHPASRRPAARDLPGLFVLDCRHGRVLLRAPSPLVGANLNYDLVVWDPLTNEQRCLPRLSPPLTEVSGSNFNAAVLCSASVEGCDHSTCHGGPFRVAFIRRQGIWSHGGQLHARVYSSATDNWSEAISVQEPQPQPQHPRRRVCGMVLCRNTLVGDTLYFYYNLGYVEYQLAAQRLSIVKGPPRSLCQISTFFFMPMGNGALGCMNLEEDESSLRLQLWSREAASNSDEVAQWTRGRAIDLEELLPNGALPSPRWASVPHSRLQSGFLVGFAEGTDVIFVATRVHGRNHHGPGDIYMVQLNSGRARKVSEFDAEPIPVYHEVVFPYTSFCIPVIGASSTTEGPEDNASACATDDFFPGYDLNVRLEDEDGNFPFDLNDGNDGDGDGDAEFQIAEPEDDDGNNFFDLNDPPLEHCNGFDLNLPLDEFGAVDFNYVQNHAEQVQPPNRSKEMTTELRKQVYQAMLTRSNNGIPHKNDSAIVAEQFGLHKWSVQRVWQRVTDASSTTEGP